jgi:hypothetical protein
MKKEKSFEPYLLMMAVYHLRNVIESSSNRRMWATRKAKHFLKLLNEQTIDGYGIQEYKKLFEENKK